MIRYIGRLMLLAALMPAVPGHAADLSGEWSVTSTFWALPHVCILHQKGRIISGSCTGPRGKGTMRGEVTGPLIHWDWTSILPSGRQVAWHFSGSTQKDFSIRGQIWRGAPVGNFVARRPAAIS